MPLPPGVLFPPPPGGDRDPEPAPRTHHPAHLRHSGRGSGIDWRAIPERTASNKSDRTPRRPASITAVATYTGDRASNRCRSRVSISGAMSMASTEPSGPTWTAANWVTAPVPAPTSITLDPTGTLDRSTRSSPRSEKKSGPTRPYVGAARSNTVPVRTPPRSPWGPMNLILRSHIGRLVTRRDFVTETEVPFGPTLLQEGVSCYVAKETH